MAWLTWNHPNMPWVATEAWVGEIAADGTVANATKVAGGPDESVLQPEWSPDGDLYFVSDRGSGWWNLHRYRDGVTELMAPMEAEFGRPQWRFGMSAYAFGSAERLICCFVRDGVWKLAEVDTRTKRFDLIPTEFTDISQVRAGPGRVVFFGGSPSQALALIDLNLSTGAQRVIRSSSVLRDGVRPYISFPEPIAFPTGGEKPLTRSSIRRFPQSSPRRQARRRPYSSRAMVGRPHRPRALSRLPCNIGRAEASACSM